jgi:hypothetical protein
MLWGCYSYYQIGPCFTWFKELKEEKKQNEVIINALNEYQEPICKRFWEENNRRRRSDRGKRRNKLRKELNRSS